MAGDGNSGRDVSLALRLGLNGARAANAAVLVIDHATKAARVNGVLVPTPVGSQQKRAWARVTVALEKEGEAIRWSVDKSNARHFEPFLTQLHFDNGNNGSLEKLTVERLGEAGPRNPKSSPLMKTAGEMIAKLNELGGECQRKDFGYSGTIDRALTMLLETGEIERFGRGRYRLSEPVTNHQS